MMRSYPELRNGSGGSQGAFQSPRRPATTHAESPRSNWANSLVWGHTRDLPDNLVENSYLAESTLRFRARNYAFTRFENVARTNELLNGEKPLPPDFQETSAGRVRAYTFGYDRDLGHIPHLATALGAQVTAYTPGAILRPIYGSDPIGVVVFLRIRPFGSTH